MTTPSLTNPNPKREDEALKAVLRAVEIADANAARVGYPQPYPDDVDIDPILPSGDQPKLMTLGDLRLIASVLASTRPSPADPVRAALQAVVKADLQIGDGHIEAARRTLHQAMDVLSASTPTGEGEEPCPQPHKYDRGECCGGNCASRSDKRWERRLIAEAICDGYSNGNEQFSDASAAIQHGCLMAADAVMALSRPVAEKPAALAHPQQGGERDGDVKRIAELEAALKPFAKIGRHMGRTPIMRAVSVGYLGVEADGLNSHARSTATVADFRAAMDVLKRPVAPTSAPKSSGEEA